MAEAEFKKGLKYYKGNGVKQNYRKAVLFFRSAADNGHAGAQYLGECFYYGDGVEQSYRKAVQLYQLAADQGITNAQYSLGYCYDNAEGVEKNHQEAVRFWRLAADQGDSDAQFNLGWAYDNGEGVEKNHQEAVRFWLLAADQGHSRAQYRLGLRYYNGEGVEKKYQEAVRFWRLAADQGDSDAQRSLGYCYYNGEGVEKNDQEAVRFWRLAADQGNSRAQSKLREMKKVPVVEKNDRKRKNEKEKETHDNNNQPMSKKIKQPSSSSSSSSSSIFSSKPPVNDRDIHYRLAALAQQPELEIEKLVVDRDKVISEGGFARVYGGSYQGLPVAVKEIQGGEQFNEAVNRELELLKKASAEDDRNVVLFVGFVPQIGGELSKLVMENCTGGTAEQFVSQQGRMVFHEQKFKQFALDVARGLLCIHNLNIIHGDLQPENVLLDSSGTAKIGDFCMSKAMRTMQAAKLGLGVLVEATDYAPLEARSSVLRRGGERIRLRRTTGIDIWSFGCLMYAVTLGKAPWYDLDEETRTDDILEALRSGETPELDNDRHGGNFGLLLTQCWQFEPENRPTAAQLIDAVQKLSNKKIKAPECCICHEEDVQFVVLAPCGHRAVCNDCADICQNCPICQGRIESVVKQIFDS